MLSLLYDPWVDRLFQNPWAAPRTEEISEKDGKYQISLEVPGCRPEDIEVTFNGRVLQVDAKKGGHNLQKRYSLPDSIEPEGIEAVAKYGVLTITLPQKTENQTRKILVASATS